MLDSGFYTYTQVNTLVYTYLQTCTHMRTPHTCTYPYKRNKIGTPVRGKWKT